MTTLPQADPLPDAAARIMALPFAALAVTEPDITPFTHGMPAGTCLIDPLNLVIGATPCGTPMFRETIEKVARDHGHDVLMLRTGLFPETLDAVSADVVLVGGDPITMTEMAFFRRHDGSLWLVPQEGNAAFIRLDAGGLSLMTHPPFDSVWERSDGLCRAAAEIVRIARGQGR